MHRKSMKYILLIFINQSHVLEKIVMVAFGNSSSKKETLKIILKVKSPGLVALELSDSLIFKVRSLKEKRVEATKRFVHDSSCCTYKRKK